jgi:hypothetical protein
MAQSRGKAGRIDLCDAREAFEWLTRAYGWKISALHAAISPYITQAWRIPLLSKYF